MELQIAGVFCIGVAEALFSLSIVFLGLFIGQN